MPLMRKSHPECEGGANGVKGAEGEEHGVEEVMPLLIKKMGEPSVSGMSTGWSN